MTDIDIPKSTSQLFDKIDNHKISDEYLSRSKNYLKVNDSYAKEMLGLRGDCVKQSLLFYYVKQ